VANADSESWHPQIAAIQIGDDAKLVDAAVRSLQPLIEEIAERVCRRRMVKVQVRLDFVAASLAEIVVARKSRDDPPRPPRIAEFNPVSGPFQAWLWTVLDNRLKDELRARRRREAHEQQPVSVDDGLDPTVNIVDRRRDKPSDVVDRTESFTSHDRKQIDSWPVLDRVLLLTVYDLWRKIPHASWELWCKEAGLPHPFPEEPAIPRDRGEWINLIAEILPASPHALQNRIRRRLEQLRREPLEYIQGIQHDK
jgi:DNA-directed RNA polymerase specialized sigma24 family protein